MARKPTWPKKTHTYLDQVTDKLVTVELTPLRLAFERCCRFLEGEQKRLADAEGPARGWALAELIEEWLCKQQPYTDGETA